MDELKERSEISELYKWDLSSLFASDEAFEEALDAVDEKIAAAAAFRGRLHSAEEILAFLKAEEAAGLAMSQLFSYSSLRKSEDTRDPKALGMYSRVYGKYAAFAGATAFAEPELLANDEETLQAIVADERLQDYTFKLNDLLRRKPHTLSAGEEKLLAGLAEALGAPQFAAEALMDTDLVFDSVLNEKGETIPLNNANYIPLQMDNDRTLRKNSFLSYYKSYKQHINTFAAAYTGVLKAQAAEAQARGYDSARAMALAADNIPESVYDTLVETVHAHMDLMYRYLRLRRRILKVDELHYYDVYAPLCAEAAAKVSYEEAQKLVLAAVKPLGTDYVGQVQKAFEQRWIDVYPNKGKSGGAYSDGCYTSYKYIMANYTDTLNDVSMIAHEMGHSMHSWYTANSQPYHYSDYSMFVAEVASTVNENLLNDSLLAACTDPKEKLALLNERLEGFKGTVYRQTMFAEFEMKAAAMAMKGEPTNAEALCSLYEDLVRLYFGDEFVIDEEVRCEWSRIPHFYFPFYVFVYATGYCSAAAIAEMLKDGNEQKVKEYKEFLSMGGSRYPLDELKHAGVDLTSAAPLEIALKKFENVLAEAEKTADELGL